MVVSVQDVQHQLDRALLDLSRQGLQLNVLSHQPEGKTNQTLIVQQGDQQFVLRLNHPQPALLGIDRELESTVLQTVAGSIAPTILASDQILGYQLSQHIVATKRAIQGQDIELLAATLKSFHAIHLDAPSIDYMQRIEQLVPPSHLARWFDIKPDFARAMALVEQSYGAHPALCHHDLVVDNILWQEGRAQPWVIDWEYAAPGDAFFDLATLVEAHDLSMATAQVLVEAYCGGCDQLAKLLVYRAIYVMLCQVWFWQQGLEIDDNIGHIQSLLTQFFQEA